jgi:hypothetical protein
VFDCSFYSLGNFVFDAGAYLSGLLQQHQDMFSELIDIEEHS